LDPRHTAPALMTVATSGSGPALPVRSRRGGGGEDGGGGDCPGKCDGTGNTIMEVTGVKCDDPDWQAKAQKLWDASRDRNATGGLATQMANALGEAIKGANAKCVVASYNLKCYCRIFTDSNGGWVPENPIKYAPPTSGKCKDTKQGSHVEVGLSLSGDCAKK
jgi:hypothetical protein